MRAARAQKPATSWRSRRMTRNDPSRHHGGPGRGRREAGRTGFSGCCRGAPSTTWPGHSRGWPERAKRGRSRAGSAGSRAVSRSAAPRPPRPRRPGWEMPSRKPKCSCPAIAPGRLSPGWTHSGRQPRAPATSRSTSASRSAASSLATVSTRCGSVAAVPPKRHRPGLPGPEWGSPSSPERAGSPSRKASSWKAATGRAPTSLRRPAAEKATLRHRATSSAGSSPRSWRSSRKRRLWSSTWRAVAIAGTSAASHPRNAAGRVMRPKTKAWWSWRKPATLLPWIRPRRRTGSGGTSRAA